MEEKYKEEEDGVQRTKREMMEEKYKEKKSTKDKKEELMVPRGSRWTK